MKLVIQRVKEASVKVDGQVVGQIDHGILIFLGVGREDTPEDIEFCVRKVSELRIFEDDEGKMNRSIEDVGGAFLVVSQFTIMGSLAKGRRPSFNEAAPPEKGEDYYNRFVDQLKAKGIKTETGQFQAMMDVSLVNDGPVTFILESPCKS